MQCAISLSERGVKSTIIEKSDKLGGKLNQWHVLFPNFTPASDVVNPLKERVEVLNIAVRFGCEVASIESDGVTLCSGESLKSDAVVVCSGFRVFDAEIKEEYGYRLYDNVYTSVDLEDMFNNGSVKCADGSEPKRIAILHCVGSRDEKVCQPHCSKVCCITGVKQAIELKKLYPNSEIFNFYMDIRMFGNGYEELYREAQIDYNVHFVRGRISEAAETIDKKIQIKSEDTLIGRPLKMSVDMLILLVGMSAGGSNKGFCRRDGVAVGNSGFLAAKDPFGGCTSSGVDSLFYAGAITSPKSIGECLNEGVAAAHRVATYLNI